MKEVLRKTSIVVSNVTYESGDFSNNLYPSNISTEVLGNRVVLSLDLSPSQPRGSKDSNSYLDAEDLKEEFDSLKFLQLHREPWLENGLRSAAKRAEDPPSLEVEFVFKDGTVRTMPASMKPDEHNFWFYRKTDAVTEKLPVSRS